MRSRRAAAWTRTRCGIRNAGGTRQCAARGSASPSADARGTPKALASDSGSMNVSSGVMSSALKVGGGRVVNALAPVWNACILRVCESARASHSPRDSEYSTTFVARPPAGSSRKPSRRGGAARCRAPCTHGARQVAARSKAWTAWHGSRRRVVRLSGADSFRACAPALARMQAAAGVAESAPVATHHERALYRGKRAAAGSRRLRTD